MSRILLADDSPHAQRMGERILRDEGHEVITVSDGRVALLRLNDASPDLIIADISMPEVSGYELCEYVKNHGGEPVLLTAGAVEPVDDKAVERARADGVLKKPFEASALIDAVSRLASTSPKRTAAPQPSSSATSMRSVVVLEPDQIRAAVTIALDAAMPTMIDQITEKVVAALAGKKRASGSESKSVEKPADKPAAAAAQSAENK